MTIAFEDISATDKSMDKAFEILLEGYNGKRLSDAVRIMCEADKNRACDDLLFFSRKRKGKKDLMKMFDSVDFDSLDSILKFSGYVRGAYEKCDDYFLPCTECFLSPLQKRIVMKALSMGSDQALLYPFLKKMPEGKRSYPALAPKTVDFGNGIKSYFIDEHSKVGKFAINVAAKKTKRESKLINYAIFYGDSAILNKPVGTNFGFMISEKEFGKDFNGLIESKEFWESVNGIRKWAFNKLVIEEEE